VRSNPYYGELWGTHTLTSFPEDESVKGQAAAPPEPRPLPALPAGQTLLPTAPARSRVHESRQLMALKAKSHRCYSPSCARNTRRRNPRHCFSPSCWMSREGPPDSWSDLKDQARKFCLDVVPKVLYARGRLVRLLVSANIGRYLEFKLVSDTSILMENQIHQVSVMACVRASK
jgi:hypothetical protein